MQLFKKWSANTFLMIALVAPGCLSAQPDAFAIDQFTVVRAEQTPTGSVLRIVINDSFEDGILPPKGPDGTGVYLIRDAPWPVGSEVGGKLHFSPDGAVLSTDPDGRAFLSQRARLATSTELGATGGLRNSGVFAVSGVFDLVSPADVGAGYGIGLTDSTAGNLGNDVVDLMVQRDQSDSVMVQFARRDWQTQQTVLFGAFAVDFSQGDQIKLALLKLDSGSHAINAYFQYFDGGIASDAPISFNIAPVIFRSEDYTRAEFQAVFAVPEPQTAIMVGAGLLVLAAAKGLRRRSRPAQPGASAHARSSNPCQ